MSLLRKIDLEKFANKFGAKITELFAKKTDIPESLPADGGDAATVNGHSVNADVPEGAQFTDTVYVHPTGYGNEHIPPGGTAGQVLKRDSNGNAVWGTDNNTTYTNFTKSGTGAKAGLVPSPGTTAGASKYLREDGTWQKPPNDNTQYADMKGATSSAAGTRGLVPAPAKGMQDALLKGDGTWMELSEITDAEIDAIIAGTFK